MRRLGPLLWIALLIAQADAAQPADPQILELDAARSHAAFEVKVLYLIGLHGEFGSVHGSLGVNHTHGMATVDATIDTNAVHMRNRRYETWTRSAEFFDAQHYPQIHFASDAFPVARLTEGGEIAGTLTIRGIARHAQFTLDKPDCDAALAGACALAAAGTIRRSEFGMRSRRGTLSDKVDLDLYIFVRPASR
jgi:polyisoprenoid-binding protein YceI